jgi:cystathionine beta-lyase
LLLDKGRVALSNGTDFGGVGKDFVRLNLATSKEIIKEAVLRMASVLED